MILEIWKVQLQIGDQRAQMAIDVFAYQVRKYIGSYVVAMGGLDAIVFTAGLGENSPYMRAKICSGLEVVGAHLGSERKMKCAERMRI